MSHQYPLDRSTLDPFGGYEPPDMPPLDPRPVSVSAGSPPTTNMKVVTQQ